VLPGVIGPDGDAQWFMDFPFFNVPSNFLDP